MLISNIIHFCSKQNINKINPTCKCTHLVCNPMSNYRSHQRVNNNQHKWNETKLFPWHVIQYICRTKEEKSIMDEHLQIRLRITDIDAMTSLLQQIYHLTSHVLWMPTTLVWLQQNARSGCTSKEYDTVHPCRPLIVQMYYTHFQTGKHQDSTITVWINHKWFEYSP